MNKTEIKRINGIRREIELESLAKHGPQHGRAKTHRSAKDKARCPRSQRRTRDWSKGD